MDYKKLYLEYKQKYLMSQKYLMGGSARNFWKKKSEAKTAPPSSNEDFAKDIISTSNIKQLLAQLKGTPFTIYNNPDDIKKINGMGMGYWEKFLQEGRQDSPHEKLLQLKYSFINKTTLEELAKYDTSFDDLVDRNSSVKQKKLLVLTYNVK